MANQGKTIRQIAEEIGVSKQAVRNQIAKLGLQSSLQKSGNQFAINKEQETTIILAFSEKTQSETQSSLQSETQTTLQSALRLLEKQNEQLSRELDIKNKQIEELTATVKTQAESINADRQKELAGTLIEGKRLMSCADPAEPEAPQTKKGAFVDRLREFFGRE